MQNRIPKTITTTTKPLTINTQRALRCEEEKTEMATGKTQTKKSHKI